MNSSISDYQKAQFTQQGFLVLKQFAHQETLSRLKSLANSWLQQPTLPYELEVETGYPGAPISKESEGATTTRRILQAFDRAGEIKEWCEGTALTQSLNALLEGNKLFLTRAHHNCLMTKAPRYSSDTGWHQDIRYWSFNNGELISAWLALGDETRENGALRVIPGSHRTQFATDAFDHKRFFKTDKLENQHLLDSAKTVELKAGDVLLFHAKLLHCASRNKTNNTKLSFVFTYHNEETRSIPLTRSSEITPIEIM